VGESPKLLGRVRELGGRFVHGLAELEGVREVRGRGLMVGVTLAGGLDAFDVARRTLEAGLVINVPGSGMLRFLPPLMIDDDDVDAAMNVMRNVLS
jgi:acetylornithine/N-succinyldiaminopimelate aminotransferase